ncbi:hypothetical protein O0I10_011776 [Lichtheimia ornata]|uniref:Uncharacterized protein n=1 Tax=Lichtheimia ornata TaxID=688661 RepID=A0AAD7UUM0_9FUNG|nr:uncharacterized protein O0I10_011776 [Lichtheimia ornata]KAJ8652571.1 hypothetical protein O0I10_011776 [Lichtheimia ornata]
MPQCYSLQTNRQGQDIMCTSATLHDFDLALASCGVHNMTTSPETSLTFDNMDVQAGISFQTRDPTQATYAFQVDWIKQKIDTEKCQKAKHQSHIKPIPRHMQENPARSLMFRISYIDTSYNLSAGGDVSVSIGMGKVDRIKVDFSE